MTRGLAKRRKPIGAKPRAEGERPREIPLQEHPAKIAAAPAKGVEPPKDRKSRKRKSPMTLKVEVDREDDGRWIADIPAVPGAMAYGSTRNEAIKLACALALRILADQLEHDERSAQQLELFSIVA
jgi:predicted RNase H-like HicB family nuclease